MALGGKEARIEERVEEEQEVAGHLQNENQQKISKSVGNFSNLLEDMHHPGEHGHVDPDGVAVRVELVIHLRLSYHQHKLILLKYDSKTGQSMCGALLIIFPFRRRAQECRSSNLRKIYLLKSCHHRDLVHRVSIIVHNFNIVNNLRCQT